MLCFVFFVFFFVHFSIVSFSISQFALFFFLFRLTGVCWRVFFLLCFFVDFISFHSVLFSICNLWPRLIRFVCFFFVQLDCVPSLHVLNATQNLLAILIFFSITFTRIYFISTTMNCAIFDFVSHYLMQHYATVSNNSSNNENKNKKKTLLFSLSQNPIMMPL